MSWPGDGPSDRLEVGDRRLRVRDARDGVTAQAAELVAVGQVAEDEAADQPARPGHQHLRLGHVVVLPCEPDSIGTVTLSAGPVPGGPTLEATLTTRQLVRAARVANATLDGWLSDAVVEIVDGRIASVGSARGSAVRHRLDSRDP